MKLYFFLILCFIFPSYSFSQDCVVDKPIRFADNWLFQDRAALKFSDNGVTSNTSNTKLNIGKASSSISDADGTLLLFTDGKRVFNGNFTELANDLHGNPNATQSSIIIPKPGSPSRFFIFTVDQYLAFLGIPLGENNGFRYSEVDISGGGSVIRRNFALKPRVSEKLTAVLHNNGIDYWVITHDLISDEFYTYLVSKEGVSSTPVVSKTGTAHDGEDFSTDNALGYLKASPDGNRLALAIYGQKKIEVFSFNNTTGVVSAPVTKSSPVSNLKPYGIEFSPDSRFLYLTTLNLSNPSSSGSLYQYDLNDLNINPVWINETMPKDVIGLQLGRDGRIYVARYNQNSLGVINNPKRPGLACNYSENGISLGSSKATMGLPNFVTSYLQSPHFWSDPKCMHSPTTFTILNKTNVDSVSWVFNDPGPNPFVSASTLYNHTFTSSGNFQVEVTEVFNNARFGPYKQTITINANPTNLIPGIPDILWLYPDTHHTLNGGTDPFRRPYPAYSWYYLKELNGPAVPISDQGSISIFAGNDAEGYYKLIVEDKNCCKNERIIEIRTEELKTTNAFNPNSHIAENQVFRPHGGPVSDYVIRIFNRLGQLVYSEENPANTAQGGYKGNGWNGKMLNTGFDCPAGVYVYQISYKIFDKDAYLSVPPKSGIVMLVR